jgi:hypothetical protein
VSPAAAVVGQEYIGMVQWTKTSGTDHSGLFQGNTEYTAAATLYPLQGYTFDGIPAKPSADPVVGAFTYTGATVTHGAGTAGSPLTVSIAFPATDPLPPVADLDLTFKVPAPVRDAAPVTYFAAPQYSGTVVWVPADGTFAADTAYTATVTLTAVPGWTFEGVAANSFTHTGKDTVVTPNPVNVADSGVVTITFLKTEAALVDTGVEWTW